MIPEGIAALIDQARKTADEAELSLAERKKVTRAFNRAVLPRREKKSSWIDNAYRDYKAGMRGLTLYAKHVPGYEKLGGLRREQRQRRLRQALAKRAERERKPKNQPDQR